ncbi:MAG: hypothetical protein KGZ58_04795 [Ignavibacteriales bacterium]|nr:hypothetical protein [Ignavibacteriales bacterium]
MVTKELLKSEIDNVPEENYDSLFRVIREMEQTRKNFDKEKFLNEVRAVREKIGGYLTDDELKQMKEFGRE